MLIFFHKQNLRDYISFDFIFRSQYHSVDGALNILSAIPTEGKDHPPHQKKKKDGVLGMIRNCVWWYGTSSGVLASVKYLFIGITHSSNPDTLQIIIFLVAVVVVVVVVVVVLVVVVVFYS